MKKYIVIISILVILLICSNVIWLYKYGKVAIGASEDYHLNYDHANTFIATSKLTNHFIKDLSKDEMKNILINVFPDDNINERENFKKENCLNTTWFSIKLSNDKVDTIIIEHVTENVANSEKW